MTTAWGPARFDHLAPGRYCLTVCYCRTCPHHGDAPLTALPRTRPHRPDTPTTRPQANAWDTREEPTWLDDRH